MLNEPALRVLDVGERVKLRLAPDGESGVILDRLSDYRTYAVQFPSDTADRVPYIGHFGRAALVAEKGDEEATERTDANEAIGKAREGYIAAAALDAQNPNADAFGAVRAARQELVDLLDAAAKASVQP